MSKSTFLDAQANFAGAMSRSRFFGQTHSKMSRVAKSKFLGAQCQGAWIFWKQMLDVKGQDFRYTQCQGAYFSNAECQGANFWHAQCQGAVFVGVQFQGNFLGLNVKEQILG